MIWAHYWSFNLGRWAYSEMVSQGTFNPLIPSSSLGKPTMSKNSFVKARNDILEHLSNNNWMIGAENKIAFASKDNTKIWFHPNGIRIGKNFNEAKLVQADIRMYNPEMFLLLISKMY